MRITCIIYSLSAGGAERVMTWLADRLTKAGHEVSLVTYTSLPDYYAQPDGVTRHRAGEGLPPYCRWFRLGCHFRRFLNIRQAIRESRPDVVVSFINITNCLVLLATRFLGRSVPVVVSERADPREHKIGWKWSLLRSLTYPLAHAVVVQTEDVAAWARSRWPRWRVAVVANAVDIPAGVDQEPALPQAATHNIVAMGRLVEQKGFDLLLEAFAPLAQRHPGWALTILGEGNRRAALVDQARALGIADRVHLPGVVNPPYRALAQADIFVLSSRFEGFPNALLEAMAMGAPAVSFDCPSGPGDIIRPGVDGLLVPAGDVVALRGALATLMDDETRRRAMGHRATEVRRRFAPEAIYLSWADILGKASVPYKVTQ